MENKLELMATLWPSFPHFKKFADEPKLSAIRLNSAMMKNPELDKEFELLESFRDKKPFFFDVKARQLRVTEVYDSPDNLELRLNHPIAVETPTVVLFKAGADKALLEGIADDGYRLVFYGGPQYRVYPGESLHIRHPSLCVFGNAFTHEELQKIEKAKEAGFTRFFLSYVENQTDIDLFLELVGKDSQVMLKIENKKGLAFVANDFKKKSNLTLVAARGDLYVEIDRPH